MPPACLDAQESWVPRERLLVSAWRIPRDLKDGMSTWDQTFLEHDFTPRQRQLLSNFNLRYECNDTDFLPDDHEDDGEEVYPETVGKRTLKMKAEMKGIRKILAGAKWLKKTTDVPRESKKNKNKEDIDGIMNEANSMAACPWYHRNSATQHVSAKSVEGRRPAPHRP
ncbi:hypothetical protein DFH09DRAFT_1068054 [Mycena vulgaris]|nr:hypothetical protein DFH09DRAFT_1068054 [Mycena vulgaris]